MADFCVETLGGVDTAITRAEYRVCNARIGERPYGWAERGKFPRCNRIVGHPGPHRLTNKDTFAIEVEWTDAECAVRDGGRQR